MSEKKLSGGSASLMQVMALVFLLPLVGMLCYIIVSKNRSAEGFFFLALFIGIVLLILRVLMRYADVWLKGDTIIIERVFKKNSKPLIEFKSVESAALPFTYYIEFMDRKRAYFSIRDSEVLKQFLGSNPDKHLMELRGMLNSTLR